MPTYSDRTDEGPLDFVPYCNQGHVLYGEFCDECQDDDDFPFGWEGEYGEMFR